MSTNLAQIAQRVVQLERTLGMPEGGPKCLPITLDFSTITSYTLDYGNMQQRGFLDMVQTVWVDNSTSAAVLTVNVPNINQTLIIPAGVQGYFPILCPNPLKLIFGSSGGTVCQAILCNFPLALWWPIAGLVPTT